MDKVVERWVTTSKPLESRGLWKRFVQERNQVLPQPKPSKSIADKYQDYLKAESYLEPKSQMFVRDEMGFDEGGRVGFATGTPFPVNDETIEKFRYYIEETDLDKKAIGEKLGYKPTAKGVGANIRKDSPIVKAYEARYGKIPEERFKPYKLNIESPQVQKVLELHDQGLSTRQITKRLGFKDEKSVRNIFKQFRPEAIQKPNIPGEITSAKKSKIKATENIKIAEKKAGVKTTKQAKDVISQIADYNEPYKNMSATELVKDKKFLDRLRMHIDINTGEVTYDGYTKARPRKGKVFSDLELAEHAIKKAKAGELFTADHITPKSLKKQNVGYPINFQPATYIENSNFDNARKYVLNNPQGDTSAIDKYLTNNKQTLRFPDQKIKLGYKGVIEYNPTKNTHTLVKKASPKQLANLLAKAGFRCGAKEGITCDRPEAYFKDIEESTKAAKEGKPGAIRKFNNAANIARTSKGILKTTGIGVLAEAGLEGGFVLNDILSGVPVKEAFQRSLFQYLTPKDFGRTKDAEVSKTKRIVGNDPRSQQYAADLQSSKELNRLYKDYITKRDDVFGAYDQNMILDAENKLYSFIKNFDSKTYDRLKFGSPEYEAFEAKQEVEDVNKLKRAMEIDPFKQKRMERKRLEEPSLERDYMNLRRAKEIGAIPFEDKMSLISSYGGVANMAGGGIAGVRRPHAIPPKSGPMPQGGGLSSMFNRVRKW